MPSGNTFVFVGGYASLEDARADYEMVKDLHAAGAVGTYDAAIVTKARRREGEGRRRTSCRPATAPGAEPAVGAVLGIIFPPSIIGTAAVGAVAGGMVGHFWHGMSRGDVKDLGEALDEGQAALIVIGEDKIADRIDKARSKALKQVEKQIDADADELKRELEEAAKQVS